MKKKQNDVVDLTQFDTPSKMSREPRHGGARDKKPFQWSLDARDYADGSVPVHPRTKLFKQRGRAAIAMRSKYQPEWPALEMKILGVPGGFVIINEHYETKGTDSADWYAVGRKNPKDKRQWWEPKPEPDNPANQAETVTDK